MERTKLLDVLNTLRPALADGDTPLLSCFAFDQAQARVTAFNDLIAIDGPLDIGFSGAVKGDLLIKWLDQVPLRELDVEEKGGEAVFGKGRMKLKLKKFALTDFQTVFQFPVTQDPCPITPEFMAALKRVAICMGEDQNSPGLMGVTVSPAPAPAVGLTLYTSDNVSAARCEVPIEHNVQNSFQLNPSFVRALLAMVKCVPLTMEFTANDVVVAFQDGFTLFGRLGATLAVEQYENIFTKMVENDCPAVPIPDELETALARAIVAVGRATASEFRVKSGQLRVRGVGADATSVDNMVVDAAQPDLECRVNASWLQRGLDGATTFRFVTQGQHVNAVCLEGEGYTYAVSAQSDVVEVVEES